MRDLQRALLFLLVVLAGAPASAGTVSLRFDSARRTLHVDDESFALPRGDWLAEMARFRAALAAGEECTELSRALGADLLGSAQEKLRSAEIWLVEPLEMAPLSALRTPWTGRPVLDHAAVSYGIPAAGLPAPP